MNITINGYTIELDYFPGTPRDRMTSPTEEMYDIVSITDHEFGSLVFRTGNETFKFMEKHGAEISAAIHAKLEEEAAQSQFEAAEYRMGGDR